MSSDERAVIARARRRSRRSLAASRRRRPSAPGRRHRGEPGRTSPTGRTSSRCPKQQQLADERVDGHRERRARQRPHRRPGRRAAGRSARCSLIDASNSMRAQPIEDAMAAARAFAAKRPPKPQLGVVTFNDKVTYAPQLTTDAAGDQRGAREAPDARRRARTSTTRSASRARCSCTTGRRAGSDRAALRRRRRRQHDDAEDALNGLDERQGARLRRRAASRRRTTRRPSRTSAKQTGGTYSRGVEPSQLDRRLRRARLQARQRVPRALPLARRPETRTSTVKIAVAGYRRPRTIAYTSARPRRRHARRQVALGQASSSRRSRSSSIVVASSRCSGTAVCAVSSCSAGTAASAARIGAFVDVSTTTSESRARREDDQRALAGADSIVPSQAAAFAASRTTARSRTSRRRPVASLVWTSLAWRSFGVVILAVVARPPVFVLFALARAARPCALIVTRRLERKRATFGDQLPDNLDVLASALRAGHSLAGRSRGRGRRAHEPSQERVRARRRRRAARRAARRGARGRA